MTEGRKEGRKKERRKEGTKEGRKKKKNLNLSALKTNCLGSIDFDL